jgi:4-diphosphocytidyl-2-C-methyl-D-erythritol kinase
MNGAVQRASAAAKVNLALVVGPQRADGLHEVATVMQRVDLCDELELQPGPGLEVIGFRDDTLVRRALELLARRAGVEARWRVRLEKRIPVAAGLGGGSADAAAALVLANRTLPRPLEPETLAAVAAGLGADVPFFLEPGPKLAEGVGERLSPLALPQGFSILLALEEGRIKVSTGTVYARFDSLGGGEGFAERRARLLAALAACHRPRDLATLPPNDLAEAAGGSELPDRLRELGAFRADLSGAGPAVYALFDRRQDALAAAAELDSGTATWVIGALW